MKWRLGLAAALGLAVMVWLAARAEDGAEAFPLLGQKSDYYNLLVDGFQEGHLYMKAEVHPGRLSPDVQVRMRSPYLLDASQYNGRYYLYFGVVPALALFWPYASLTGHDCPENLAVLLAVAAGFMVSLRLYADARARYFSTAGAWLDFLAAGLLALAVGSPVLLVSGGMYEVALSWGYLSTSVMAWCLFRALHSKRSALTWLGLASLAYGLGVGCRPTVFVLGPLLPATAFLVFRDHRGEAGAGNALRLAGAVIIPAGLIGLGLMFYNHARFADPLEFGLNHQINAIAGSRLQNPAFIPANLRWYYFTPPTLSAYFPYLFPHSGIPAPAGYYLGSEPTHGQLPVLLLLLAGIGTWIGRRPVCPPRLRGFLLLLGFAFLVVLLVTSVFCYRSSRYLIDFQPFLILLLVLATGLSLGAGSRSGRWAQAGLGLFACLGAVNVLAGLFVGFQFLDRFASSHPEAFRSLAYYGNYPAGLLARLGWHQYGPVRFKAVFTQPKTAVYEALVATGSPGYKDVLFAAQHPNGYVDFILYHEGYGGARSPLLPVEYGRPYEIELDLGSLHPPLGDDYFPGWKGQPQQLLRTFARMTFDGKEVIRTRQSFYESSPGLLEFGRATGRPEKEFSGRIQDVTRLPVRGAAGLTTLAEAGVWRFDFELPPPTDLSGQPVLSSGTTGRGNLLLLRNLPDGTFQCSVDFWGMTPSASPPLPRPAPGRHVLEVFVGAQARRQAATFTPAFETAALQASAAVIRVWLDGQPIWSTPLRAYADTYDFVGIGTNTQGFSTAQSAYAGWFQIQPLSPAERRALVEKNLALPPR